MSEELFWVLTNINGKYHIVKKDISEKEADELEKLYANVVKCTYDEAQEKIYQRNKIFINKGVL